LIDRKFKRYAPRWSADWGFISEAKPVLCKPIGGERGLRLAKRIQAVKRKLICISYRDVKSIK